MLLLVQLGKLPTYYLLMEKEEQFPPPPPCMHAMNNVNTKMSLSLVSSDVTRQQNDE